MQVWMMVLTPVGPVRAEVVQAWSVQTSRQSHSLPGHSRQVWMLVLRAVEPVWAEVVHALLVQGVRQPHSLPAPLMRVREFALRSVLEPKLQNDPAKSETKG